MRHIQTVRAVKETIASGDDCPLKHQCYHFRSRGFLPRVPRAFHPPPRRVEDGFPRIVELRCASPNRLLLQSREKKKKKSTGFGDRHHAQWLTLWWAPSAAQKFSPHHSLTAPWERGERRARLDSQVGFLHLLRRFFKHCILELAKSLWGYCVRPVTQCIRISHFQVEWMQHFIHSRDGSLLEERIHDLCSLISWRCNIFGHFFCLYESVTHWVMWMVKSICECVQCNSVCVELLLINLREVQIMQINISLIPLFYGKHVFLCSWMFLSLMQRR